MKFYFVRHSETLWNKGFNFETMTFQGKKIGGDWVVENHPEWFELSDKGEQQARTTAEKLCSLLGDNRNISIFGSPALQVKMSVRPFIELVGCGLEMIVDKNLTEFSMKGFKEEKEEEAIKRFLLAKQRIINSAPDQEISIIYGHQDIAQLYFSYMLGENFDFITNGEIISYTLRNDEIKDLTRYKL